ncbi:hypothetical protein [Synechococcus sp. MU1655]|uniref:hypothetical protein n=1 Tax=Synechococcus sp. MU1655 TaxID=2508355 RepID=UPI0020269D99|nr:hypothetical protein [Synechococcus sp. MU1655]
MALHLCWVVFGSKGAITCRVAVVVVGVDQGKQPDSKRPVESKGELERLLDSTVVGLANHVEIHSHDLR